MTTKTKTKTKTAETTMATTEIVNFDFSGQEVRMAQILGEPWFVGKDVCEVLGISKYRDAFTRLDSDERGSVVVDPHGREQVTTVVSEAGIYTLIVKSRKPSAKKFKKWVNQDVLPTIHKLVPMNQVRCIEF